MIRGAEQDAAQPEEVAGNLEIDNLTGSAGQKLIGAHPAIGEDKGRLSRLALTHQIHPCVESPAALVEYLAETVRRVGDPRVQAVPSTTYPGDPQDAHPTREQHAAMARDLAPQMRKVMGW